MRSYHSSTESFKLFGIEIYSKMHTIQNFDEYLAQTNNNNKFGKSSLKKYYQHNRNSNNTLKSYSKPFHQSNIDENKCPNILNIQTKRHEEAQSIQSQKQLQFISFAQRQNIKIQQDQEKKSLKTSLTNQTNFQKKSLKQSRFKKIANKIRQQKYSLNGKTSTIKTLPNNEHFYYSDNNKKTNRMQYSSQIPKLNDQKLENKYKNRSFLLVVGNQSNQKNNMNNIIQKTLNNKAPYLNKINNYNIEYKCLNDVARVKQVLTLYDDEKSENQIESKLQYKTNNNLDETNKISFLTSLFKKDYQHQQRQSFKEFY